jgi:hypothetical protein
VLKNCAGHMRSAGRRFITTAIDREIKRKIYKGGKGRRGKKTESRGIKSTCEKGSNCIGTFTSERTECD